MPDAYTTVTAAQARRLVDAGHTKDAVASMLGISLRTVYRMATGEHASTAVTRCPGCGHTVLQPCQVCAARVWQRGMSKSKHART